MMMNMNTGNIPIYLNRLIAESIQTKLGMTS